MPRQEEKMSKITIIAADDIKEEVQIFTLRTGLKISQSLKSSKSFFLENIKVETSVFEPIFTHPPCDHGKVTVFKFTINLNSILKKDGEFKQFIVTFEHHEKGHHLISGKVEQGPSSEYNKNFYLPATSPGERRAIDDLFSDEICGVFLDLLTAYVNKIKSPLEQEYERLNALKK